MKRTENQRKGANLTSVGSGIWKESPLSCEDKGNRQVQEEVMHLVVCGSGWRAQMWVQQERPEGAGNWQKALKHRLRGDQTNSPQRWITQIISSVCGYLEYLPLNTDTYDVLWFHFKENNAARLWSLKLWLKSVEKLLNFLILTFYTILFWKQLYSECKMTSFRRMRLALS